MSLNVCAAPGGNSQSVVIKKNLIFGAFQKLRLLMPPHATNLSYAPKVATAP